jgi:hypothetical protein
MDDLYAGDSSLGAAVGPLTPRLTLAIDDLAARTEEDIVASLTTPLGKLAMSVLRAVRVDADPLAVLDRAGPRLREVRDGPDGSGAFEDILRYLSEVRDADLDRVGQRVAAIDRGLEKDVMTLAERLRNEGSARGRAEMLLKLLTLKFGPPSEDVRSRVQRADEPTLDRWAERVLTAGSVDELFA